MRLYKIIFAVLTFIVGVPCFAETALKSAQPRIKIGVSLPLTGDAAIYGQDIRDILNFANATLRQDRYEFVFEDDKCAAKEAVSIANKFINSDGIKYVIGFPCSASIMAAAPIYEKNRILTMVTWASSPKVASAGDFIFRTTPSDMLAAKMLWSHIAAKHKQVAILSAIGDYPQDMKEAFLAANSDSRLEIISEDYLPHTSDLRSTLTKLAAAKPQALFLNTEDDAAFGEILKNLYELKWTVPVYAAYWPSSATLLASAKDQLDGVEFVDTPELAQSLTVDGAKLYSEYVKRYGKLRGSESTFTPAFEGFRALTAAIESGKDSREYLYSTKFNGIQGDYSFDKVGDTVGVGFVMKRIEKGAVVQ